MSVSSLGIRKLGGVSMIWSSNVKYVQAGRSTPPPGAILRVKCPEDGTLFHIREGASCHPLDRDGLDFHPLERADEREVDVGMIARESQTICSEGLQVLELPQNVEPGSHLADIHLESDEAAEDGRELGLTEGVYGIGRREFHVGEIMTRAVPHNVDELVENDAVVADSLDFERLQVVHRPAEYKSRFSGVEWASMSRWFGKFITVTAGDG